MSEKWHHREKQSGSIEEENGVKLVKKIDAEF